MKKPCRFFPAFTLVEIMIVVVIIGLLAVLAVPVIQRAIRRSQNSRIANDLRVFAQAFETFATENGAWPPNAGNGIVPAGMAASFKTDVWKAKTAVGGAWNWDCNVGWASLPFNAAISLSNVTATDAQMAEIDAMIDDGDLSTGWFVKSTNNRYSYILEY